MPAIEAIKSLLGLKDKLFSRSQLNDLRNRVTDLTRLSRQPSDIRESMRTAASTLCKAVEDNLGTSDIERVSREMDGGSIQLHGTDITCEKTSCGPGLVLEFAEGANTGSQRSTFDVAFVPGASIMPIGNKMDSWGNISTVSYSPGASNDAEQEIERHTLSLDGSVIKVSRQFPQRDGADVVTLAT